MACECPTAYCEYDEDTVDVVAGGKTIDKALENAKTKAKNQAQADAEAALAAAIKIGDKVCKPHVPPCLAWFRIWIGEPDSQEYPFHSNKRQFALGWCDWKIIVKCELPEKKAADGKNEKAGKSKGRLY